MCVPLSLSFLFPSSGLVGFYDHESITFDSQLCLVAISGCLGLIINAGVLLASGRRLIFGGPVRRLIALWYTGKSLSSSKCELLKLTRSPSVSLVSETRMFLCMLSLLIRGGPL